MKAKLIKESINESLIIKNGRYEKFDEESETWEIGRVESIDTEDGPNTGIKLIPDKK